MNVKPPDVRERPDAIYWRRAQNAARPDSNAEICEIENLWFWPGTGPCVDGYYYWIPKPLKHKKPRFAKRIPLEVWRQYGKRNSRPDQEHTTHNAIKLELFS